MQTKQTECEYGKHIEISWCYSLSHWLQYFDDPIRQYCVSVLSGLLACFSIFNTALYDVRSIFYLLFFVALIAAGFYVFVCFCDVTIHLWRTEANSQLVEQ